MINIYQIIPNITYVQITTAIIEFYIWDNKAFSRNIALHSFITR